MQRSTHRLLTREHGWERLSPLLCQRCGSLLPLVSAHDLMLSNLARLARFGLAAGEQPIVKVSL
ncbi:MAG: hypothetical protein ACRELD_11415 [Longimicrobiales bacterium]